MDIKDLNILIGPNNSGKTSVLQTLVMLKQSVSNFNLRGKLVNLGDFGEIVYKHDFNNKIEIGFSLKPKGGSNFHELDLDDFFQTFDMKKITYSIVLSERPDGGTFLDHVELLDAKGRTIVQSSRRAENREFEDVPDVGIQGFVPILRSGESRKLEDINNLSRYVLTEFEYFLHYISSMRGLNRRQEAVDASYSQRPSDVGIFGEKTIPLLAYIRDDEKYAEVNKKIDGWLEEFGLTNLLAKIAEGPTYSLKVRNRQTEVKSNIVDVGFGLNQLVPIIVQCFYAPKESLILIEQPEAHLHPRAQAKMADFLIDVVNYGNRVMVETHSEHLLLRLQRRVAEKKIKPESINVCYFDQTQEGTRKLDMAIDDRGYFAEPIPEGFFEEGFQEAFAHLKALGNSRDQLGRGH